MKSIWKFNAGVQPKGLDEAWPGQGCKAAPASQKGSLIPLRPL